MHGSFQLFLDAHENESNDKTKTEEVDFFADCESDLNDFPLNNSCNASQAAGQKVGCSSVSFYACLCVLFNHVFVVDKKNTDLYRAIIVIIGQFLLIIQFQIDPKTEETKTKIENPTQSEEGPSVDFLNSTVPIDAPKSTIGIRKIQPKRGVSKFIPHFGLHQNIYENNSVVVPNQKKNSWAHAKVD